MSDAGGERVPPPPVRVAAKGLCPRCGAATLFAGFARFAERCGVCGLNLTQFNVGDGPAAFLTLIVGTIVTAGVVIVQVRAAPPLWVQMAIWIPVSAVMVAFSLRFAKGLLLALEYRNASREGRIAE